MKEILLLGSSLLAGTLGTPLLPLLSALLKSDSYHFKNEAVNGLCLPGAIELLKSKKEAAAVPRPDCIVVMLGGNDLTSLLLPTTAQGYAKMQEARKGRDPCTIPQFLLEWKELVQELIKLYGQAVPIFISDIKTYGEDEKGSLNDNVRKYNEALIAFIEGGEFPQLKLLKIHDPLVALSIERRKEHLSGPYSHVPPLASDDITKIVVPSRMIEVFTLNKTSFGLYSFDVLGEARGCLQTCDGSHWNTRSAACVAEIIVDNIKKVLQ